MRSRVYDMTTIIRQRAVSFSHVPSLLSARQMRTDSLASNYTYDTHHAHTLPGFLSNVASVNHTKDLSLITPRAAELSTAAAKLWNGDRSMSGAPVATSIVVLSTAPDCTSVCSSPAVARGSTAGQLSRDRLPSPFLPAPRKRSVPYHSRSVNSA
jgi:hypothetical protein